MIMSNNKKELLDLSEKYFQEIIDFVKELPDEIRSMEFLNNEINERDKTVSDVLCHLHEWHEMLENWYKIGMKGKIPEMPMEGYNWKQLTAVNEIIYEKYKGTDIKIAANDFKNSHNKLMKIMEGHNNKELFETLPYEWTGKIMLGNFFDSNMSHHYQWGLKTLKRLNKFIQKINNRG